MPCERAATCSPTVWPSKGTDNGDKGTDNGDKGTNNGDKGTDNGDKGTDNGDKGTDNARAATCSPTVWPRSAASSDESTARMNSFEVAAPGAGAAATLSSASAAAQSTYV
jgi:hypothetical protein